MEKDITFTITHSIKKSLAIGETNEVLVLSPIADEVKGDMLFLHGHQFGIKMGALENIRIVEPAVAAGYRVIIPSILGYGKTTGAPDYCGPETIRRLFETIRSHIAEKLHVVGGSRGGLIAVLFAEQYPDHVATCTAGAGTYDLEKLYATSQDQFLKKNIADETDLSQEAFSERNPRTHYEKLTMPIQILHGQIDEQIPVEQATEFAGFLKEQGMNPTLTVVEKSGHKLFSEKVFTQNIIPFFNA